MDRPKLSAMRSMTSIPRSIFFAGNMAKIRRYPGMNRRNGTPRIVRIVVSMDSNVIGSNMVLQRIHRIMSRGYFDDVSFMIVLLHSENGYNLFSYDDDEDDDKEVDEGAHPIFEVPWSKDVGEFSGDEDSDENKDEEDLKVFIPGEKQHYNGPCGKNDCYFL